jgi:hypothetical protein
MRLHAPYHSVAKELNRPSGARRFQKHNATLIASITTANALRTEHSLCGTDVLQVPLAQVTCRAGPAEPGDAITLQSETAKPALQRCLLPAAGMSCFES